MNRTEFVEALAVHHDGDRRRAAHALASVLDTVARQVASGGRVSFVGFGAFESRERAERTVRNPRTGEPVLSPARRVVRFVPGAALRAQVAGEKEVPPLRAAPGAVRKATRGASAEPTAPPVDEVRQVAQPEKTAKSGKATKERAAKGTATKAEVTVSGGATTSADQQPKEKSGKKAGKNPGKKSDGKKPGKKSDAKKAGKKADAKKLDAKKSDRKKPGKKAGKK